jgi:DNA modification methylase
VGEGTGVARRSAATARAVTTSRTGLDVDHVPVARLVGMAAAYNPRTISDHDLDALRRSLRFFGAVEPVVANRRTNRIVGGHQRVRAAELELWPELPVVWVDLDEPSEKQLNLALNRISGTWDETKLAGVLADLQVAGADLALTGFTGDEVEEFLRQATPVVDGLTDPDDVPEPPDDPVTRRGELILLGDHLLLCGDSASASDVARLTGGLPVQLVNTDPPYNVKVEPRTKNAIAAARASGAHLKNHQRLDLVRHPSKAKPGGKMRPRDRELVNDFLPAEEFAEKLRAWFKNLAGALAPGGAFYIWGGYANLLNYPAAIAEAGLYFSQGIIWHKQWPVLTRKDFLGDHEWCFYGWREGAAHWFNPEIKNATDHWQVRKVSPQAMVHLTEKPVELAERALAYSSRPRDRVLDLFGGSGSTLIAAERLSRHSLLMEIDPAYCDVIVQRWEAFTGKRAKRPRGKR